MTAEEAAEAGKDLDFAKVWAAMMKTDERLDKLFKDIANRQAKTGEMLKENQRLAAEGRRETAGLRKVAAETSRKVDKVSENLGGIGNTVGKLIEAMFSAELWKKFHERGFKFTRGHRLTFWEGENPLGEVDSFLENGEYTMAVEIKTELFIEDVNEHIERMGKLRHYMDEHQDKRKLIGAVAGGVAAKNVTRYAQKKELFALVQSGGSIAIAETPEGFVPKEW
jgi:regulator of replication initiation timing